MSLWWERFQSSVANEIKTVKQDSLADVCKVMAAMLQSVNAYIANPNPAAVSDIITVISSVCNYLFTSPNLQSACSTVGDDFVDFLAERVDDVQRWLILMLQTYCATPAIALAPASSPTPGPAPAPTPVPLAPAPASSDMVYYIAGGLAALLLVVLVAVLILRGKNVSS